MVVFSCIISCFCKTRLPKLGFHYERKVSIVLQLVTREDNVINSRWRNPTNVNESQLSAFSAHESCIYCERTYSYPNYVFLRRTKVQGGLLPNSTISLTRVSISKRAKEMHDSKTQSFYRTGLRYLR